MVYGTEFVSFFILSFLLIWIVKRYALRWGFVDVPNHRSIHSEHTPRGAGIGFFLAVFLQLPLFDFSQISQYMWTLLGIFLVFIIGVLDDHHDTSPNMKFIVLVLATILLYADGLIIDDVGTFFGLHIRLAWLSLPFTIFAVTSFTNALNLIDGLDGLAATVAIIILSSFFSIGYHYNDTFMMILSLGFIASLLAFLFFNWHPASIFMGDSGSLPLGFVISILAVKSLDYIPAVTILFIAALPIFDTVIIVIRRKRQGKSIFVADHCHMHHIFTRFFMKDIRKTVFFFGVMQASYSIIGLQLGKSKNIEEGYLLILFGLNIMLLYLVLSAMIKRQKLHC